jgi:hypothetical protein
LRLIPFGCLYYIIVSSFEKISFAIEILLTDSKNSAILIVGDSEEMRELCSVTAAPRLRAELGVSIFLPFTAPRLYTSMSVIQSNENWDLLLTFSSGSVII